MANSASGDSVIDRLVRVLETFSSDRTVQTASEIGRSAGLPSASAHRLVDDLVHAGVLDRDEDRRVQLGMRLWELALRGSVALRLRQAALPHMDVVQRALREHTQLAVLERDEALFIERLSHPDAVSNIAQVAGRLPLHASSAGLILLAHADQSTRARILAGPLVAIGPGTITDPALLHRTLQEIRRSGVVVSPGTIEQVSTGIAVPIRDAGEVVAALSAVLPRGTDPEPAIARLQVAARATEDALKRSRP